ncbi:2-amino-4-hydroxy-6-hydroxymethyldihydropteridine diphosphokinase [Rhodospirillum centenum]|uniref:2-amino-4-hydroxy-6-hydroxymethyldihydropteridine pyrophosphokinase n=1 Tax=Rhodospirillum centenum (strain ATCC 51521 / SW) TaxID=414684 RepID=B6IN08_RHOCS|nr:2-amino-4-hydroxy-6-hydroxymethyldihydropteridine diphosphokinase [Rhodospirillum centenum]ACI98905.1 2-amino-4-hydroxy-6- hydroxymethyldihydropteridine pyrophosphokinase [Rhodospirillum centenum SW]
MILIGLGSNLAVPGIGGPLAVCTAALAALERRGLRVVARSRWYETAPVPVSDQPWFVNAVAQVESPLGPDGILSVLHAVEAEFGRVRQVVNEARVLDLDLLDHDGQRRDDAPMLPHPRMHLRAFVLLPLAELAPGWVHPVSGRRVDELIADLPPGQDARSIPDARIVDGRIVDGRIADV